MVILDILKCKGKENKKYLNKLILVEKNCLCVDQDLLYLCILILCVCMQKILNHVRKHKENFKIQTVEKLNVLTLILNNSKNNFNL